MRLKFPRLAIAAAALSFLAGLVTSCSTTSCCGGGEACAAPNTLTAQEKADGWRSPDSDSFPNKSWVIKDGVFSVVSSGNGEAQAGGDIITRKRYSNFELQADFMTTYRLQQRHQNFCAAPHFPHRQRPANRLPVGSAIGLEYQILDDAHHPDAKLGRNGDRKLGALYDLFPCDPKDKR